MTNMDTKSIVVIEDDKQMAAQLKLLLEMQSFKVSVFHSAEDYLLNLNVSPNQPYLYLLDLNLPGLGGCELVKVIRFKDKVSPIFMISGATQDHDLNTCLSAGADDYVLKPYNPDHLLLKIQNAFSKLRFFLGSAIDYGVKLVPEANLVARDGIRVQLTNREFAIIEQLITTPDEIHTREVLVKKMGCEDVTERTIDVHVSSLRKKIEKLQIGVETLRGKGYRILLTESFP